MSIVVHGFVVGTEAETVHVHSRGQVYRCQGCKAIHQCGALVWVIPTFGADGQWIVTNAQRHIIGSGSTLEAALIAAEKRL